jgi:hypothetical protein
MGLSYAALFVSKDRYKWGPGIDILYDESPGAWVERYKEDGKSLTRVVEGKFSDRFSVGLSIKGELALRYFSPFVHLGYDIVHHSTYDSRFYQIMGLKVYPVNRLFLATGIRSESLYKAMFIYWSIGYTIKGKS